MLIWEPSNPSFPWFRDFWTCPWAPKPILSTFGDTRALQVIQEESQITFETFSSWNARFGHFEMFGNVCPIYLEISELCFWNWKLWNLKNEILELRNFKTLKRWQLRTLKLWDQDFFYIQVRESSAPLNIPTPTTAPDHPLGGHEWAPWRRDLFSTFVHRHLFSCSS